MIRVKGFVYQDNGKNLAIQFSGNNIELQEINRAIKQTELVAIGFEMTLSDVKNLYFSSF